jgi:hypothetical protein
MGFCFRKYCPRVLYHTRRLITMEVQTSDTPANLCGSSIKEKTAAQCALLQMWVLPQQNGRAEAVDDGASRPQVKGGLPTNG